MIDPHDSLDRLFRAARRAPERAIELPAGFELRVLAAWQRRDTAEEAAWALALLRRAIVISCAVALLSVAFGWPPAAETGMNELAQADIEITSSLLP